MLSRLWLRIPAALGLCLGLFSSAFADDLPADTGAGKKLIAEGDALADKGQTTEALLRYKQAFEQILPGLRKLPFHEEVKRDVTAREDLKEYLIKDFEADQTPEEFHADEQGLKALGFLPRDMDYKDVMVKVLSQEIAAFYDPRTQTMHLIKEPEAKAPTFLERLMGKTGGFDKEENQTVLAHELTHALADQHFNLRKLHDSVKNDDDMDLAISALIEGEATLTMTAAQMEDWDGTAIAKLPAADLDRAMNLVGPFLPMFGSKDLRSAPAILRESMVFPYLRGLVFCARLVNDGDWKAIDEAYKNPPISTEQILHPDKYKTDRDVPMAIDLGKLEAGPGWKEIGRNVVGELQLSVLLKSYDGRKAAAGWDGDGYAVFEGPDNKLGLVWTSTWDSEEDAREFFQSYARFQTTKLGDDSKDPLVMPESDNLRRTHDSTAYAIERRGMDVAVVEGFPEAVTQTLIDAALAAKKSEKTFCSKE